MTRAMHPTTADFSQEFFAVLATQGYSAFRACGIAGLCAVKRYNCTWGLTVNLDPVGYERRYCYETQTEARAALEAWNGEGHPTGPWIKCKGGSIDLLNPTFGCDLKSA